MNETILLNATFDIKKNHQIIHIDSLGLSKGDFTIIKGPNGSGKSTLLKSFLGRGDYFSILSGSSCLISSPLLREENNIYKMNDRQSSIFRSLSSYMGQEDDYSFRTIDEQLKSPTENALKTLNESHIFSSEETEEKKKELAELIKYFKKEYLDQILKVEKVTSFFKSPYNNRSNSLSGGQKKMVSFISYVVKSIVIGSILLLLDEPLNNLDRENKMAVNNILADLKEKQPDIIILIITHCSIFYGINKSIVLKKKDENKFSAEITPYTEKPYQCLQPKEEMIGLKYRILK